MRGLSHEHLQQPDGDLECKVGVDELPQAVLSGVEYSQEPVEQVEFNPEHTVEQLDYVHGGA